ncbi:MAG TPA: DNA mismatch repair endonuclease MutL [Oscillospiraceae bacterium]|nr:DNA mismatch repair endonuclease MutL [Oscillospiraceae bacterium]
MGKIYLLDEITANKIAAGEVVERPAAVVKELVENALDAGAHHIEIQITGGGLELIRVVDNGSGMAAEDVSLALQRHATSKIKTASDLDTVLSLGFRGEALPSIASVSRFRLLTRRAEELTGTELIIHGGKTVRLEEAGSPVGTEIKVEDLFYNTPARLKFIKSVGSETAKVTDTVQRLALAWPEVAFILTVNGKNKLITPGNGQQEDAAAQILGRQNMRQMVPVKWVGSLLTLRGFVSKPSLTRANRNLQYFFVNRRPIRSPLLADALQTAYHTLLPRHRFPAAVLYLELDPLTVDVNVHPTKREVRFAQERDLYRQLLSGVKEALKKVSLIGEMRTPPFAAAWQERAAHFSQAELTPGFVQRKMADKPAMPPELALFNAPKQAIDIPITPPEYTADEDTVSASRNNFPALRPLGQYLATYILAQSTPGDLYLIDQHAAHERILYDLIKKDLSAGELPVQSILPQTFELDAISAARLQESLNIFLDLGLEFETFGNNTFILRTVPLFFKDTLSQEELMELLTQHRLEQGSVGIFEKAMQLMSCKGAIKANHTLDKAEMATLITNLAATTEPHTCPHGRPTVMILTAQTVAKNFRRA